MEYAAVFLLFTATAGCALRLAASKKGAKELFALVLLTCACCLEPFPAAGTVVAPATMLLACYGAAAAGYGRNVNAVLCALVVAAVTTVSLSGEGGKMLVRDTGLICSAVLCAVVCTPRTAGGILAFGSVLGDTYSVLVDETVALCAPVFSLDAVYFAITCTVISAFFNALVGVSDKSNGERGGFSVRLPQCGKDQILF